MSILDMGVNPWGWMGGCIHNVLYQIECMLLQTRVQEFVRGGGKI